MFVKEGLPAAFAADSMSWGLLANCLIKFAISPEPVEGGVAIEGTEAIEGIVLNVGIEGAALP